MCIGNIIDDDGGIIIMSCVVYRSGRVSTHNKDAGPGVGHGYCGRRID
jgi:hypothetical protein